MDLTRLQQLKQKLLHDKELALVWSYFLTHFGENVEFIRLGERIDHPFLEAVVAQVGRQLFGRGGAVSNLLLTQVEGQPFVHGAFTMGGRVGGVFFFEDAGTGLVAVPDLPPSIEVKYARFSGHPIRGPGEPSRN